MAQSFFLVTSYSLPATADFVDLPESTCEGVVDGGLGFVTFFYRRMAQDNRERIHLGIIGYFHIFQYFLIFDVR